MIQLIRELLKIDSAYRHEAAVALHQQLFITLFPTEEIPTIESFTERVNWMLETNGNTEEFFINILIMERRHLLVNANADQLLTLVTNFIAGLPQAETPERVMRMFINLLCMSSLVVDSTFEQMNNKLQHLLLDLCQRFFTLNWHLTTHPFYVVSWIQLFVFVGDRPTVQQLTDKICSFPPYSAFLEMTNQESINQ